MIEAILFDLGDTVFHTNWKDLNEAMKKEAGIPSHPPEPSTFIFILVPTRSDL